MTNYKYHEVIPLRTPKRTIWLFELESGKKRLEVWHEEANVEDVVKSFKTTNPSTKFVVHCIDVGSFWIDKVDIYMCMDGRGINQDMEVVLLKIA